MITVWGRQSSSNVQKVLWGCAELGLTVERVEAGGAFGVVREQPYLAMNPNGRVPTLQDGQLIVWESNTILRYLCNRYDGAWLYPVEPASRTQVERWMDWQLASFAPPTFVLHVAFYRTPPEERDAARIEAARLEAAGQFAILDAQLAGRDFVAGDFSIADICLGMFAHRWYAYPIERLRTSNVRAWYDRLLKRGAFQQHVAPFLS